MRWACGVRPNSVPFGLLDWQRSPRCAIWIVKKHSLLPHGEAAGEPAEELPVGQLSLPCSGSSLLCPVSYAGSSCSPFPCSPSQAPGRHMSAPRFCIWHSGEALICPGPFRLLSNETPGGRVRSMGFHRWLSRLPVAFASALCFSLFSSSYSSM